MELLDYICRHLVVWLLVLVRVSGIFISAPIFSSHQVPVPVRVLGAAGLTVALAPLATPQSVPLEQALLPLVAAILREALLGLALGLLPALVFLALQYAAELIDLQVGMGMGGWVDPTFQTSVSPFGNFQYMLGTVLFLTLDAHHLVIGALARSFALVPLGTFSGAALVSEGIVALFCKMALFGVQLAAPVLAVLLVADLGLGILNRVAPQINLLIMTPSLKAVAALLAFSAALPLLAVLLAHLFAGLRGEFLSLLRAVGASAGVSHGG